MRSTIKLLAAIALLATLVVPSQANIDNEDASPSLACPSSTPIADAIIWETVTFSSIAEANAAIADGSVLDTARSNATSRYQNSCPETCAGGAGVCVGTTDFTGRRAAAGTPVGQAPLVTVTVGIDANGMSLDCTCP
ncbi:MAG: hypothetical protein AAFU73_16415 [Planctomycetota bacterium]